MAYRLGFSALRWRTPDLEPALEALNKAGWDGWEGRLPLDWLGTPARLRRICENAGMPMAVFTANGTPDSRDRENVERNRRRIDFAAEAGADCFMYMTGRKPEGRPVAEEDIRMAAEGAERWADYAAQYGLEISYHIHTNTLVDSVDDWKLYMSLLQRARLCIDVSHAHLWGYEPGQAIRDFRHQLNYVHLQDYASTTRAEDGRYLPVWCDVGQAESVDFRSTLKALGDIGYERWVTACPGDPIPGDGPAEEASRSAGMVSYLRDLGY